MERRHSLSIRTPPVYSDDESTGSASSDSPFSYISRNTTPSFGWSPSLGSPVEDTPRTNVMYSWWNPLFYCNWMRPTICEGGYLSE